MLGGQDAPAADGNYWVSLPDWPSYTPTPLFLCDSKTPHPLYYNTCVVIVRTHKHSLWIQRYGYDTKIIPGNSIGFF